MSFRLCRSFLGCVVACLADETEDVDGAARQDPSLERR